MENTEQQPTESMKTDRGWSHIPISGHSRQKVAVMNATKSSRQTQSDPVHLMVILIRLCNV